MVERASSWWQFIKTHRITIQFIAIFLAIAIILILIGYQFDWTGFNEYTVTVKSNATSGTTLPTKITVYLPIKTLYDWLQLLFIPVVLAIAGFWFNHRERKAAELRDENERKAAELRAKTEQELALDNQREAALQAYINEMSELLLHEDLSDSQRRETVSTILRLRTITILFQLDARRVGYVFSFLHEYELMYIDTKENIISFRNADLENINFSYARLSLANLSGARLNGADLSGATLVGTNLSDAQLVKANLSDTNLASANLSGAYLRNANLSNAFLVVANLTDAKVTEEQLKTARSLKGATMPDGSKHP
jgi:uncharacterized protein YjbI with pentapeptide repeats